jgi:hypothetical protein
MSRRIYLRVVVLFSIPSLFKKNLTTIYSIWDRNKHSYSIPNCNDKLFKLYFGFISDNMMYYIQL